MFCSVGHVSNLSRYCIYECAHNDLSYLKDLTKLMSGFINEQGRDSSIFLIYCLKKNRKKSLEATLDYI